MRSLQRRLEAVEVFNRGADEGGATEDHFLRAWPPADDTFAEGLKQCTEHGPTCAVRVRRVIGRARRLYIFDVDFIGPPLG